MINKKMSKGLLEVQMVNIDSAARTYKSARKIHFASTLEGLVQCPFCSTTITAIQTNFLWDVSDFECHLEVAHLHQKEHIENQDLFEVTAKNPQKKKNSLENNFSTINNKTPIAKNSNQQKLVAEKGHQSFSEVLKESVRTFKFEKSKKNGTLNSNCSSINHLSENSLENSKRMSNELLCRLKLKLVETPSEIRCLDLQKEIDPIFPNLGKFIICSLLVKESMAWPNIKMRKHFIGKICRINGKIFFLVYCSY